MEVNERIETLEGELKLLKGEMKETLTSVRDFLQGINLSPASNDDVSLSLKGLGITMHNADVPAPEKVAEKESNTEEKSSNTPEEPAPGAPQQTGGAKLSLDRKESIEVPSSEKEANNKPPKSASDNREKSASQVNMLANLIRWVSAAKNQIGMEQLPTLLDVYGMAGHMSPDLKQIILHIAGVITDRAEGKDATSLWGQMMKEQMARFLDVYGINGQLTPELKSSILHLVEIMAQRPPETSSADVWSRLILELHGILATGSDSLDSLKPFWNREVPKEEENEPENDNHDEKDEDMPIKLRFAVPLRSGEEREFSINLTPEIISAKKSSAANQKK